MALAATSIIEIQSGATGSNVNGGGFNPSNANMLTDLTTDSNTANTNSPIVSSASYNFVAGDVNNWLYIQSGTNWTPGWYKIASVAANKATLSAAVGAAVQTNTAQSGPSPRYNANTVAGIATTGTPTGGVFAIDYSQVAAAVVHSTDGTSTASTTFTSATGGITKAMIGNFLHLISATGADEVVGWYEIVNVTDANTITLDRTSGTYTLADFYIGGAMSLNSSLDDELFEIGLGSNGVGAFRFFFKGNVTFGEGVNTGASGATQAPVVYEGYQTLRGDTPTGDNRPLVDTGANAWTIGNNRNFYNLRVTGTGSQVLLSSTPNTLVNVKATNTSTTAARQAFTVNNIEITLIDVELISYRGRALQNSSNVNCFGLYLHDSDIGLASASGNSYITAQDCIIADNVTAAIGGATAYTVRATFRGMTLFGASNKLGIGLSLVTGSTDVFLLNSIVSGFVTGVSHADVQTVGYDDYNSYYNNTTDVTNWQKGPNTIALDPGFTDVTQITGTGATSSTNVLTVGSGTPFGDVEDNVDFLLITSGTGTGIATNVKLLITAHTSTTLTVSSNITSSGSGSSIVWQVTTGHDFSVGTNMKAAAFPGTFPGL